MNEGFDLIVIGTGTAGRVAASRVSQAGRSVAVVDFRRYGGTCALRGCDPKKLLVGVSEAKDHADRMTRRGVNGTVRIDWREALEFKRSFTEPMSAKQEDFYASRGIARYHGNARFLGPNQVSVGEHVLHGERILIATGAEPARLGIPGEEHLATSDNFLELEQLPKRMAMVGGGYVAAEFSHIAARAGVSVTVLQRATRMLKRFDGTMVDLLMKRFEALGIDVKTGAEVKEIEKTPDSYGVRFATRDGESTVDADLVVHAAGRIPALTGLDLEKAAVDVQDGRLDLNEFLQSRSNPAVYAAGDAAAAGPPLTPVSNRDGAVAGANILEGNSQRPDYRGVPTVAFTIPPIASVGMSEEEAREACPELRVHCSDASGWFTALQQGECVYGHKLLSDKRTGTILGAHFVGPHVDEVVNIFALAIRHGLTAEQLTSTMFAYPSGASDISSMLAA